MAKIIEKIKLLKDRTGVYILTRTLNENGATINMKLAKIA